MSPRCPPRRPPRTARSRDRKPRRRHWSSKTGGARRSGPAIPTKRARRRGRGRPTRLWPRGWPGARGDEPWTPRRGSRERRLARGPAGLDVLVQPEQVVGVVAILERHQPVVFLGAERFADAIHLGREVEVWGAGGERPHRLR